MKFAVSLIAGKKTGGRLAHRLQVYNAPDAANAEERARADMSFDNPGLPIRSVLVEPCE